MSQTLHRILRDICPRTGRRGGPTIGWRRQQLNELRRIGPCPPRPSTRSAAWCHTRPLRKVSSTAPPSTVVLIRRRPAERAAGHARGGGGSSVVRPEVK